MKLTIAQALLLSVAVAYSNIDDINLEIQDNWCKTNSDCISKIGPSCKSNETPECQLGECYCIPKSKEEIIELIDTTINVGTNSSTTDEDGNDYGKI